MHVDEMMQPHISKFGEIKHFLYIYFVVVVSTSDFILKKHFVCQFARMSYLWNLVICMNCTRAVAAMKVLCSPDHFTFWDTRFCHLSDDMQNICCYFESWMFRIVMIWLAFLTKYTKLNPLQNEVCLQYIHNQISLTSYVTQYQFGYCKLE